MEFYRNCGKSEILPEVSVHCRKFQEQSTQKLIISTKKMERWKMLLRKNHVSVYRYLIYRYTDAKNTARPNLRFDSLGMLSSLDEDELQMLEISLKDLPPVKQRRIMRKAEDYVCSNSKLERIVF